MNSYSVKIFGNLQRVKPNGCVSLYFRVIINGVSKPLPLNLEWPAKFVDNKVGRILPRTKGDPEIKDHLLIIDTEIGKVLEIFKIYRIQDLILNMDTFLKEYKFFTRRKDFLVFMQQTIKEQLETKKIVKNTHRNLMTSFNRLKKFQSKIFFHEINAKFLTRYAQWLSLKHENEHNTIWGRIKDIKTYLHLAEKAGIAINNDIDNYINTPTTGRLTYLDNTELNSLILLYQKKTLPSTEQQTLRAFLFSCFTSIRISDVQLANWNWVTNKDELEFLPWKTRRFKRYVKIPLSKMAFDLIQTRSGKFFTTPCDQEMNRCLKTIAIEAKIKKHLTSHVSRHTFGTRYYRDTKDLVSLQVIMGHSKTKDTMVYLHINDQDKRDGINKMEESLMSENPGYLSLVHKRA